MNLRAPAIGVWTLGIALAACTNGGGLTNIGGGGTSPSPLPTNAIGVAIPNQKIGVENDPVWGTIGGYTEEATSQVLAFPPGAQITIKNLSSTTPHTLNVIGKRSGPPPNFPPSPSLSFSPSGNGVLGTNYASGTINPGASVTVTLSNPGIYLIGCAFHYISNAMRDVIQVVAGATPGPTASPGPGGYAARRARHGLQPTAERTAHASAQPLLVDQTGRHFTLSSLLGRPLIVTFVAAHCTDACPLINAQFADASRRIASAHLSGRLLTVTLDPEHDSPATMRVLAQRFEANPRYWLLAAGSIRNVHAVMREFAVVSEQGRRGFHDEHTTFVYVFNKRGELVQTMLASSALSDSIVDALRQQRAVAAR
ncbi:MAG: SCO family protein [Candidatus Eremiobacteraeota bacterium]|nr:SCO family protein [Candidatus Eremiobacteraeota bacterium]